MQRLGCREEVQVKRGEECGARRRFEAKPVPDLQLALKRMPVPVSGGRRQAVAGSNSDAMREPKLLRCRIVDIDDCSGSVLSR